MKKFLSFFCGRGAVWLYLSILAMAVCPTMVSALGALIKGSLLGETEVFFTEMTGSLTGWVFLCFAFGAALNEEYTPKKALRLLPRQLLNGVLPILAVYAVLEWLFPARMEQMPLSVYLFVSLIETLLFLPVVCRLAVASKKEQNGLFIKGSAICFISRHLLTFVLAVLCCYFSKQLGAAIPSWLFGMKTFEPLSRQFLLYIPIAALQWAVLIPVFKLSVRKLAEPAKVSRRKKKKEVDTQSIAEIEPENTSSIGQSPKNRLHIPGLAAAAVFFAVFIGFTGAGIYRINTDPKGIDGPNRGYVAMSAVDECIAAGDEAFDRNDYIIASVYYDYAKTLVAAWQGYLYDSDLLEEALEANPTDAEIVLLSALATDDPEGQIKRLINENIAPDYLLEALLSIDGANGKREALHRLVSRGIVQKRFVFPNALGEEETADLEKAVSIAHRLVERRGIVKAYYYMLREGDNSPKAVQTACELANQYPDDFYLQTFATEIMWYTTEAGGNWIDNEVLVRYAEMLRESTTEDETDKILSLKAFISRIYMNASDDKEALEFLDSFFPEVTAAEIDALKISLFHGDRQYDKALELAQEYSEKYPDDVANNSYLAVGMLPRDPDTAIESALRLANTVTTSKDAEEIAKADAGIGVFLEYIFGYYTAPNYKFCGYQLFYSSVFSEEQKQKLQSDPVIGAYLELWTCQDYNEKIRIASELIDQYASLPYALYERGYSRNQLSEFSDALTDLSKSLELDPMNAFAYIEQAVAYEGVGDYAGSLKAIEEMDLILDELEYHPTMNERGISVYINVFLNNTKHAMYEERTDSLLNPSN